MFIPEANAGIGSERHVQRRVNRNIGHIFHHDANVVKGIIFGPRMCEMKKKAYGIVSSQIWRIQIQQYVIFLTLSYQHQERLLFQKGNERKK
ncbi:hypothetical protein ACVXG9_00625 [Escherichia coli]